MYAKDMDKSLSIVRCLESFCAVVHVDMMLHRKMKCLHVWKLLLKANMFERRTTQLDQKEQRQPDEGSNSTLRSKKE